MAVSTFDVPAPAYNMSRECRDTGALHALKRARQADWPNYLAGLGQRCVSFSLTRCASDQTCRRDGWRLQLELNVTLVDR